MSDLIKLPGVELSRTAAVFTAAGLTKEKWAEGLAALSKADSALQWWIGDFAEQGVKQKFAKGNGYTDEEAESLFGMKSGTVANLRYVASNVDVSLRNETLTWKHHYHVAWLPPRQQKKWLAKAVREGLSASKLKDAIRQERLIAEREKNPIPAGKYSVIYSDPPWHYNDERVAEKGASGGGAQAIYPTMKTEELCDMAEDLSAMKWTQCALFLWATAPCLPDAKEVMDAWGFEYKAQFVWDKVRGFNGHYNDVCHELLLIGTHGSCIPKGTSLRKSVVTAEKTEHSKKPDIFYEIIEEMYDGPYLEMFARRSRGGQWSSWGNQVDAT